MNGERIDYLLAVAQAKGLSTADFYVALFGALEAAYRGNPGAYENDSIDPETMAISVMAQLLDGVSGPAGEIDVTPVEFARLASEAVEDEMNQRILDAERSHTLKSGRIDLWVQESDEPEEPSWHDFGNCLGIDPELFFPERGASTREAKEICRGCIVREDCLEYALQNGEKFGIWGGMSERERRRIRRQRALQRSSLPIAVGGETVQRAHPAGRPPKSGPGQTASYMRSSSPTRPFGAEQVGTSSISISTGDVAGTRSEEASAPLASRQSQEDTVFRRVQSAQILQRFYQDPGVTTGLVDLEVLLRAGSRCGAVEMKAVGVDRDAQLIENGTSQTEFLEAVSVLDEVLRDELALAFFYLFRDGSEAAWSTAVALARAQKSVSALAPSEALAVAVVEEGSIRYLNRWWFVHEEGPRILREATKHLFPRTLWNETRLLELADFVHETLTDHASPADLASLLSEQPALARLVSNMRFEERS